MKIKVIDKNLDNFSDTELLMELIQRNGFAEAPIKTERHGVWNECLIAIGTDETASICLPAEAMSFLLHVFGKEIDN